MFDINSYDYYLPESRIAQEPVSLETPIGEEEDSQLSDFLEDKNLPSPEDAAAVQLLR